MKKDYQKEMERVLESLSGVPERPELILHACCAPCLSGVLERVTPYFRVTVYYYNPNIQPYEEFERRFDQFPKLLRYLGLEREVTLLRGEYDGDAFLEASRGLEGELEGGARCPRCFALRLRKTLETAEALGASYFATTLTVSPHKNAEVINGLGQRLSEGSPVKWLPADFKKRDGYLLSIRRSREAGLYRQDWCGCDFAKKRQN